MLWPKPITIQHTFFFSDLIALKSVEPIKVKRMFLCLKGLEFLSKTVNINVQKGFYKLLITEESVPLFTVCLAHVAQLI